MPQRFETRDSRDTPATARARTSAVLRVLERSSSRSENAHVGATPTQGHDSPYDPHVAPTQSKRVTGPRYRHRLRGPEMSTFPTRDDAPSGTATCKTSSTTSCPPMPPSSRWEGPSPASPPDGSHTCAIMASNGAVRCWGSGGDGRLGYGNVDHFGDDETPADVGDMPLLRP